MLLSAAAAAVAGVTGNEAEAEAEAAAEVEITNSSFAAGCIFIISSCSSASDSAESKVELDTESVMLLSF